MKGVNEHFNFIFIHADEKCQDYVYIKWEYWSTM